MLTLSLVSLSLTSYIITRFASLTTGTIVLYSAWMRVFKLFFYWWLETKLTGYDPDPIKVYYHISYSLYSVIELGNRNRPRFEGELSCLRSIGLVSKCDEPFAQRDADKFACRHWSDDAAHRAQSIISVSMFAGWCEREELELGPNGHVFHHFIVFVI